MARGGQRAKSWEENDSFWTREADERSSRCVGARRRPPGAALQQQQKMDRWSKRGERESKKRKKMETSHWRRRPERRWKVGGNRERENSVRYLFIFFEFLMVNGSDLCKFSSIVRMFYCIFSSRISCCSSGSSICSCTLSTTFFWSCNSFSDQHIVQPHELWIWWFLFLGISKTQNCSLMVIGGSWRMVHGDDDSVRWPVRELKPYMKRERKKMLVFNPLLIFSLFCVCKIIFNATGHHVLFNVYFVCVCVCMCHIGLILFNFLYPST